MSRTTALQVIAGVIFSAIMYGIYRAVKWSTDFTSSDFQSGLIVGVVVMCVGFLIANRMDRSSGLRGRKKQGPRDTVDF